MLPGWAKIVGFFLLAAIGGTVLWWQLQHDESLLRLDGHSYHMTTMRTEAELQKGLSGTKSLPAGEAMLFVFPRDDQWGMWMKDMNYPIDMVWLNSSKQVVYTVKNAQPSSYPKTIYKPTVPARYVIELPSGTIDMTGIKNGDPAGLPSEVR
jgi:uncharacterized membrane protein (UPF0127 family)